MKKRILVYSVDALVCEDVDALRAMPNFRRYLAGGCEVTGGMRTIYPSVTYPAHVSMMTGCYAGTHGVTSNFAFTTTNKDDFWLWFSSSYRVEDIFAAAKRAGYTTGAISWPVMSRYRASFCSSSRRKASSVESWDISGWDQVWFPTVWPSAAMRRTRSGSAVRKSPTRKNAAGAPCFFRASRMGPVLPFS